MTDQLKITTERFNIIDARDLDKFIYDVYGHDFDFAADRKEGFFYAGRSGDCSP
jgi:hypothetical protein